MNGCPVACLRRLTKLRVHVWGINKVFKLVQCNLLKREVKWIEIWIPKLPPISHLNTALAQRNRFELFPCIDLGCWMMITLFSVVLILRMKHIFRHLIWSPLIHSCSLWHTIKSIHHSLFLSLSFRRQCNTMIGISSGVITWYVELTMNEQYSSADDKPKLAAYDTARSVNDINHSLSMSLSET